MLLEIVQPFCCPPITLLLQKMALISFPLLLLPHTTIQKRSSYIFLHKQLKFIYCLYVVCFIHYLSNEFLTSYHDPDTVLILADTKMKGGLVSPVNVADMENCQHSKRDECQNESKYRYQGKLQQGSNTLQKELRFLKQKELDSNPSLPLTALLWDLRQIT